MALKIAIDRQQLAAFCQRWKILKLDFFGSVLRDDFGSSSDIDVLVTFAPEAGWSLFDHVRMEDELGTLLGRPVDLVTRRAVERSPNWIRRNAILECLEPGYVASK